MTQRILLQFISLRHLIREKRTWLTLTGVALGISVFVSIRIANQSVLSAYHQSVDAFAGETTLEVIGRSGPLDENILIELRKDPDILKLAPVVQAVLPMSSESRAEREMVLLLGVDLLEEASFRPFEVEGKEGRFDLATAFNALLNPRSVLLSRSFAERHGLQPGDRFSLRKEGAPLDFEVGGLMKGEMTQTRGGNIAVIDIAAAQWRLEKLGVLDRIDLITADGVPVETILSRLSGRLGDQALVRRPRQRNRQIENMLFAFQLNLTALSAISLFVGLFLIYNTLLVSVAHRRKEIGLLRSLGVHRAQTFKLFTVEGVVIGVCGGFLGVLAGALLARWVVQMLSKTVTALYVAIPPSPLALPPALFAEGILIGVAVSAFSALFPAWQAARLKPREAMEGIFGPEEGGIGHRRLCVIGGLLGLVSYFLSRLPIAWGFSWNGYLAAALLLIAFSLIVPSVVLLFSKGVRGLTQQTAPSWRLAQGHLEQAIRRNAPTISAFMAALAMMISVVIMIESFRTTVVLWIDQTIQSDIIGFPASYMMSDSDETLPAALFNGITRMPEVKAVDGYRSKIISFRDEPVELVGRDLAVHAEHSKYLFQKGDPAAVIHEAVAEQKVLISEVLANRFHVKEGDAVTLPTPEGPFSTTIGGVFYDYGTDGGKMVIDRALLRTHWRDHKIDVVAIYLNEDTSPEAVREKLLEQWGNTQGLVFTVQTRFKAEIMEIFDQTFLITYALEWIAIVVALLGIANTLFVSILERKREIGIFRAVGASRPQVLRVVLVEAFYMGVIGNIVALVCGLFLSLILIFVINKASFGWTLQFHFPPAVILHSFLLAIGTALLAGYFPARKAAETDLREAMAYE
ncbi:MAG: FtsX-like permease family protein [Nitrospiria bacterium]